MTEQLYHRLEILFTTSYIIYVFIHTQLINNTKLINPKFSEELVNPGFSDWVHPAGSVLGPVYVRSWVICCLSTS